MKNRNDVTRLPTTTNTWNGNSWVTTVTFPATHYNLLQVGQDFDGVRNTSVPHAHAFTKTLSSDYIGSSSSSSGGVLQQVVSGNVMAATAWVYPGIGEVPYFSTSSLYNQALSKVYDQVRGQVDWAVNVMETRQTVQMVREYRDHLIPLADKLAKDAGRIVRFVRTFHPKQWGRRWLEYQYGVKPLVTDMHQTMVQMLDFATNTVVRVKGRASQTTHGKKKVSVPSDYNRTENIYWTLSERCHVEAVFQIPQSRLQSLANYTSLNPASLIWETLPASFLVDWLWNVGGFLRSMESACLLAAGLSGGFVTHTRRLIQVSDLNQSGTQYGYSYSRNGKAYSTTSYKARSVVGTLYPNLPVVDLKLGWQRLFSAASLLSLHVTKR